MHSIPTYVLRYSIKEKHGIFLLLSIMFHISTFFTCHYFTFIPDICQFSLIYNLFSPIFHLFSCFVTYFPNCSLIFLFCHLFSQLFTCFPVLSLIFLFCHLFPCQNTEQLTNILSPNQFKTYSLPRISHIVISLVAK